MDTRVKVVLLVCVCVCSFGGAYESLSVLSSSVNALTLALDLNSVLRPKDQRRGSNTGGGDLSDWSQTFFHHTL